MAMPVFASQGVIDEEDAWDPDRWPRELASLCGLPANLSTERCGRSWCNYFDPDRRTCGLLLWDVPGRLGPEALRWFTAHRAGDPRHATDLDQALAARCASL
jgi:hypothetical protein